MTYVVVLVNATSRKFDSQFLFVFFGIAVEVRSLGPFCRRFTDRPKRKFTVSTLRKIIVTEPLDYSRVGRAKSKTRENTDDTCTVFPVGPEIFILPSSVRNLSRA